uniref:RING finger protein 141 n=2 Tax=Clastoptera arizonana TaxID=38151 RepID=A0A1B6CB50_9HEMI
MGNSNSDEENVDDLSNDIVRQARTLTEIATLTFDEFQSYLTRLNILSQKCMDNEGNRLVFAVKKGTDSTVLWKGTVKIACVKVNPESKQIDNYRLLNLSQFLRIFKSLNSQFSAAQETSYGFEASTSKEGDFKRPTLPLDVTTSMLFNHVIQEKEESEKFTECCICLERKPDVLLPCAHSYCRLCIEQWSVNHKTCPLCRDQMDSCDDAWVISEAPNTLEINEEICSTLMELVSAQNSVDEEDEDLS